MTTAVNRRENVYQEAWKIDFAQPVETATLSHVLYDSPTPRYVAIDGIQYINPTGFAQNAAGWRGELVKNGSTVVATIFDTTIGALAADAFVTVDMRAQAMSAVRSIAPGDTLAFRATKVGSPANLPIGRLRIEGRLVAD